MMPRNQQSGFSLIEMIVSLGVFSIVVTTAVGALLVVIATNQQLQAEQTVMTNLAFAMDSMTREMRTGYNYFCETRPNYASGGPNNIFEDSNDSEDVIGTDMADCTTGRVSGEQLQGVSFYEGGESVTKSTAERVLYFYDADTQKLMRRVGNGDAESIVSSGILITNARFYVTGSQKMSDGGTNFEQPTITIYLEAKEKDVATSKVYHLQTTVTQRTLDI
jgi:prepilin-type N-terminal cleavage/methylation domain-containing protein